MYHTRSPPPLVSPETTEQTGLFDRWMSDLQNVILLLSGLFHWTTGPVVRCTERRGGRALLNPSSSSSSSPPPPHGSALLTLLAVCDVTLKMHDSHAVSLSMGLLCVCVCVRARRRTCLTCWVIKGQTHTHTHTHTRYCVGRGRALSKPKICYLTDGCGRLSLRLNAPERAVWLDGDSELDGRRVGGG